MGENKKAGNGIGGIISNAVVDAAVPAAIGVAVKVANKVIDQHPDKDSHITVPELYRKGFLLELDQAVKLLEDCGLKSVASKVTLKEAAVKYKDYSDMQVIDSNPKQGASVNPGSIIYLKYITADVIEASQKIFDDAEAEKMEKKEKKAVQKLEQQEKRKEAIKGVTDKISKVFNRKKEK